MSLFNKKTIDRAVARAAAPAPGRLAAFKSWADAIKSGRIGELKETELHGSFMGTIAIAALGYRGPVSDGVYSVTQEKGIIQGAVDLALGSFGQGERRIIAPFELKGAKTKDLDAIMPGRAKSPVDQAWEYATNNIGTRWVLLSNYLEIRLYSYAEGRQAYEVFDLARLHEPAEFARAQLLLSAESLLGGRTAELLEESHRENHDITDRLYSDYKALRESLVGAVRADQPRLEPLTAIRVAQTILDRVLFVAFAEDQNLLPSHTLEKAYQHRDPYDPQPVWRTFQALFRSIDRGNSRLDIPRYNGGLFALDPVIDALQLPDAICEGFKTLAEYDFASEVSVTVLGHIFEQSIADVEQLQAAALGQAVEAKKASGTSGRRKRDGVVYTPDYIARFIVDRTLGTHARELFAHVLREHAVKGATPDDDPIKWRSKAAEQAAWSAYRERLAGLRIVDPACGSGVFLVMAFDWIRAELTRVNAKLAELSGTGQAGDLFDPDSDILTNNLFGVDVNEESVEIAKLSLWIKTARRGKVLDSLDANLRVGDSLIEDASFAYRKHGFVWRDAFPEVFACGGFDVVLGNPPYVRMELLKPMKPWLEKRYAVVSDRADLYAYFFERGLKLLRPGGRLGYISSATFFKTGSGAPLRDFIRQNATLETVVNFGDNQVFEGVTTYPAILTMRAGPAPDAHPFLFWNVDLLPAFGFAKAFDDNAGSFQQNRLGRAGWELASASGQALRDKIRHGRPTLKAVCGSPQRGVVTGLNEAFVIDTPTKERLCREHSSSKKLLKPFLEGKDLKRWRAESRGLWLIYVAKNRIDIENYPAVRDWLLPFKKRLEARATVQQWFELQQPQEAYAKAMAAPKISYPHFSVERLFSFEPSGSFSNDKTYFVPTDDLFLLALLNSRVLWFIISNISPAVRGGFHELRVQYMETLPIPTVTAQTRRKLVTLAGQAQETATRRLAKQREVTRRIPDLRPKGNGAELTTRLREWWKLADFAAFQAEIKKAYKTDIPLRERSAWDDWLSECHRVVNGHSERLDQLEQEIDILVYEAFALSPDEVQLVEAVSRTGSNSSTVDESQE